MSPKDAPPRLGRGLAALLGDAPISPPAGATQSLPVANLEPSPFQPRRAMAPEALAELADSIRQRGVLQPVLVRPHPDRPSQYQIIAGERRWRAAQQAELHDIPVLIRSLTDSEAMAASLVENLQRQDLNPIEEAEGYRRLTEEFGLTQDRLGEAVGKSRSHLANMMRLLNLPASVRVAVEAGTLSAGHARALLGHPDPEAACREVLAKGLSVRQTEALVRRSTDPRDRRGKTEADPAPEIAALERELSEQLGLRVEITAGKSGGSLRITYRSLDQLDHVIARLRGE